MKKSRRNVIAILLASVMLMMPATLSVSARVTEADKQKIEEQIANNDTALAEIAKKLEELRGEESAAVALKAQLDAEATVLQENIELTEGLIETYEQSIQNTILEISERQRRADEQYEQIKTFLRTSYESGNMNYLEILFSSSSLIEFMTRVERLRSLMSYQENQIKELETQRTHLASLKERYESDLAQTKLLKQSLNEDKVALQSSLNEAEQVLSQLKLDTDYAKQMQAAYEAAEAEFEERLQQIVEELEKQAAAGLAEGSYIWPCLPTRTYISSYFGGRPDPFTGKPSNHIGIDIPSASGEPIFASNNGVVVEAGSHLTYGNYIMLSHGDGIMTLYAHNSSLKVSVGDVVRKGDVIASAGTTGKSTGPHCHFEVRIDGVRVDPLDSSNRGNAYVKRPS